MIIRQAAPNDAEQLKSLYFEHLTSFPPTEEQNMQSWRELIQYFHDDDFIKLQHSEMMLDEEIAIHLAETLMGHIWVMYVNKTDHPFYTSDNPVLTIPHKRDKYMSYGGYASDGVEICGTRGWFFEEERSSEHDEKIFKRELIRLEDFRECRLTIFLSNVQHKRFPFDFKSGY